MPDRELQTLLDAVRRRLWRGLFVTALRRALWGSAALLALASALTLVAGRIPVGALVIPVSGLWVLWLAWAARRRPANAACALWADRHLGGASAFTTLLELDQDGTVKPDAAALRRLKVWSTTRMPESLKALADQPAPVRLARPLLATMVCAALAAFVLDLSDSMPTPAQRLAASSPAKTGDRAASGVGAREGGDLAIEIAKAVRAAERREQGRTQETAAGGSVDVRTPPGDRALTMPPGARPVNSSPVSAASEETIVAVRNDPSTGTHTDSGRGAGNSIDPRADAGMSRTPQGTMAAQGYELKPRRLYDEMQADMDQQGRYDEEPTSAAAATVRPVPAVAAATPPTATESTRLTPMETSYVQAWMKASAQRR